MRRRPCSMTKKQYKTRTATAGTVKEIERDNSLAVVAQKREPAFGRIAPALNAPKVSRNGRLGKHEAELLQFAVDPRSAPVRILLREPPDQDTDFLGDLRPPSPGPGAPAPRQAETRAIPSDDRLGLDDHQYVLPARQGPP
jgi:hypothetical protein